ncbi:MAG: hypothetical protein R3E68_15300 [Burkholderiaceae bacterium]
MKGKMMIAMEVLKSEGQNRAALRQLDRRDADARARLTELNAKAQEMDQKIRIAEEPIQRLATYRKRAEAAATVAYRSEANDDADEVDQAVLSQLLVEAETAGSRVPAARRVRDELAAEIRALQLEMNERSTERQELEYLVGVAEVLAARNREILAWRAAAKAHAERIAIAREVSAKGELLGKPVIIGSGRFLRSNELEVPDLSNIQGATGHLRVGFSQALAEAGVLRPNEVSHLSPPTAPIMA